MFQAGGREIIISFQVYLHDIYIYIYIYIYINRNRTLLAMYILYPKSNQKGPS